MATTKKKPTKPDKPQVDPAVPAVNPITPNPEGLRLFDEFDAVALWMALPRKQRDPEYQSELAEKHKISQDTISDWKKLPEFWARVDAHRQNWIKDDISDVVDGLIKKAKYGSAAEVKLFLQFAGVFTETTKVEQTGQTAVTFTYVNPEPNSNPDANATPDNDQAVSETAPGVANPTE